MQEFKVQKNDEIGVMGMKLPSFRALYAKQLGVHKNVMIFVSGGLGDAICAEPAIRWGVKTFKDCTFTIATLWPELFRHIPVKEIIKIDTNTRMQSFEDYYHVINTLYTSETLHSEFLQPMWMNVVDYHSIAMWRYQLPLNEKHIELYCTDDEFDKVKEYSRCTVVHPGLTWQSRTIPSWWWNEFINAYGKDVVLIGTKKQTVEIEAADNVIDLRDQLTIMETVALCKRAFHVVTNDSSPVHMAAPGVANIWFFATAKHPDFITHVRNGQFSSRMTNISLGGLWQGDGMIPERGVIKHYDKCTDEEMKSWLSKPEIIARKLK